MVWWLHVQMYKIIDSTKIHHSKITEKSLKHAFNSLKGCWMLPLKKGGCFQNQQLLVRISWHSYDQHVIAASSWWSRPTLGDGNWLCGAAGPELSCNSYRNDIWMVCGHESVFCDHSWHGTLCHSHSCISFYIQEPGRQKASLPRRSCTWSWGWLRSWWRSPWSRTRHCPTPHSPPPPRHTRCLLVCCCGTRRRGWWVGSRGE